VYSRILLAYDGSTEGRSGLREGALVARRNHAQVFLLSVITEGAGTKLSEGVGGAGVSQQLPQYEAVLREGLERLQALGFEASAKLAVGEAAEQIGAYAREVGADLVVVGHRRQSALGRWWSGPRGAYLVDHIGCSLLVCRAVSRSQPHGRRGVRGRRGDDLLCLPGLQPPYLQDLMNYPVVTAGLVMGPRGLGTMAAMMVVGKLIGRIDTRALLGFGLALSAWSFYAMSGWTPAVSSLDVVVVGVVQGVGLGFLFTPLSVVSLSTLSPQVRPEGAGFYNLARNVGSSIGISVVSSVLTRQTQVNHAEIARYVTAANRLLTAPPVVRVWNPFSPAGRATLDHVVTQQAQIIAYVDDYRLLMFATLAVIPMRLVFQGRTSGTRGVDSRAGLALWGDRDQGRSARNTVLQSCAASDSASPPP
jgi:nucleotide-binding universal stress UspA family protein